MGGAKNTAQLVVLCGVILIFVTNSKAVQEVCFGSYEISSGNSGHSVYRVLVPYSTGSITTLIFKKTGIGTLTAPVTSICYSAQDDIVSIL
jgi:3-hydroxyisobutyrate dehydrogenase-like beta-hydroxyacid dehydrogenase